MSPQVRREVVTFLLLSAAALLSFICPGIPLQEPQEVRYAEIPRQMLVADSWLIPVLHGEPYLDKPPLLYWLVMASFSIFGVHDWSARLIPCSATFLTILVTYFWARRTVGLRGAFLTAMMLAVSVRYIYLARLLTMDTLLCLFVVVALAGLHLALRDRFRRPPWFIAALACGLGLLTKGPVAVVLVCVPVFLLVIVGQLKSRPGWRASLSFVVVMTAVAAPWYVAVVVRDPEFARYFFWKHHVERFVTPFDHQEPFWFYLPVLVIGMLPWTLLLPGAACEVWRRWRSPEGAGSLSFFLIASAWCLLFFSLSGCKRPAYILPAMPLLALALGAYLDKLLPSRGSVSQPAWPQTRWHFAAVFTGTFSLLGLLLGLYVFLPGHARRFSLRAQVRPFAELCTRPKVDVACFPRRWDSVSFYLGRDDVQAYTKEERDKLVSKLCSAETTLLYVKSAENLDAVLCQLPPGLEYAPLSLQGELRVGIVRHKDADPNAP